MPITWVIKMPKAISSKSDQIHQAWELLTRAIEALKTNESERAELIEAACRLIWDLWSDEEKREAMGWASWNDLFHPGNEELTEFFNLIEDRITLTSESNRHRFYNLLLIDSDPTLAELHLLRRRHWTYITQFNSRITALKKLMNEPDGPAKREKALAILAPTSPGEPETVSAADWRMERSVGYWQNRPAVRLSDDSPLAMKLRSRLIPIKVTYVLKRNEATILAVSDQQTKPVAEVLLPQSDETYQGFIEFLERKFGIKVVG